MASVACDIRREANLVAMEAQKSYNADQNPGMLTAEK
jgi:hypothetical protein